MRSGSDGIYVAIFEISAEDKLALDKIEGLGSGYSELVLTIPELGDCASYAAQTSYIDDALVPYDWYKELVLMGAHFHGFPDDYLKQIISQPACQDPDPDRRARRWEVVQMIKDGG